MTTTDRDVQEQIEPGSSSYPQRLQALKTLHQAGIKTWVFIGPILPEITDWQTIIEQTKPYADEYLFDKVNVHGTIWQSLRSWLQKDRPDLLDLYKECCFHARHPYWTRLREEIELFCRRHKVSCEVIFGYKEQLVKKINKQMPIF